MQNRNLIPYGIALKIASCAGGLGHRFAADIPGLWKPFALFDLVWAPLFFMTYRSLEREGTVRQDRA